MPNTTVSKPSIQLLFEAMQKFMVACQKAEYSKSAWDKARQDLHKDLEYLNVANNFDWSE